MVCGTNLKNKYDSQNILIELPDDESPSSNTKKTTCKKALQCTVLAFGIFVVVLFLLVWVVVPVTFMLSVSFETFMVFLPVNSPRNPDFSRPETFGLQGVHNFYLPVRDYHDYDIITNLGIWLVVPECDINTTTTKDVREILKKTDKDVLIYLHGVFANRAKALEQYRVLRKHFIVIAVDHRGYGDSGRGVAMTEVGIAHDYLQIDQWVRSINPTCDLYYWGHSLGSAMSSSALVLLPQPPTGVVLEAPFTTLQDILENIALGRIFSWLAYFDACILRPLDRNRFHFRSRDNVLVIDSPIMILHAQDDEVVPYFLGEKLARITQEKRRKSQGNVTFHGFAKEFGYGHVNIILHPEIDDIINDFKRQCRRFNSSTIV